MKDNYLIAVTGGIGSGKSRVLSIIKDLGYPTLSCDQVTDEVYKKCYVKRRLAKIFPQAKRGKIFIKIDKKIIAKEVFSNKEKLKELTDFLTPIILEQTLKKARKTKGKVFIEVPLLFECKAQDKFDKIIVVKRELSKRIESVIKRSNLTKEQVLERINSQFDYDGQDLSCYQILSNDGDLKSLEEKVKNLI